MQVVELRVDRNLACPNFDGYRLSFDPVAVLRDDFDVMPFRLEASLNEYSRLHSELFARHNLLCADPWMRHSTFFINASHQVMQCIYDPQIGRSLGLRVAYTMDNLDHGDGHAQMAGDYNYSICFVSERFCVICDGGTTYHLLDTGDRSRPSTDPWKLISRTPVDIASGMRGYVLYDARMDVVQERKQISLVAGHITRRDAGAHPWISFMDLVWSLWALNPLTNQWEYTIRQRLETTGSLQYCAFEPRAESLILGSNRKIQTRQQREDEEAAAAAAAAAAASPEEAQNGHDVAAAEDAGGEETNSLNQANHDDAEAEVEADESAGPSGAAGLPIPNLEDPIEDCDLGNLDDDNQIVRFNLPKNEITHTIFLGSQPVVFVTTIRPGFPPAFATREGVDASVWLQVYQPSRPDEWGVRHVGQMHAFGYVQASKEDRKFTACCPEFEYTVICEGRRTVFIYHARYANAEGLRHRNGPPVTVGKTTLMNTGSVDGDILGIATASNVVTILTERSLLHLQL